MEKGKDLAHIVKVKDKYDLVNYGKEFSIPPISDPATRMEAMILTHKLLHVLRTKKCTACAVMLAALYVEGVQINWS